MNTARRLVASAGSSTSALCIAGNASPGRKNETESWNGSAWTEVNNVNTARHSLAGAGADNTNAIAFGGDQPSTDGSAITEDWNGASWVEVADLSTGRRNFDGRGTSTAGLATGGSNPPSTTLAATEEWSGSSNTIKVLTD